MNQLISTRSRFKTILNGISQELFLGLLIFLCCIRGIPAVISSFTQSKIGLYAVHANLLLSDKYSGEIENSAIKNHESYLTCYIICLPGNVIIKEHCI